MSHATIPFNQRPAWDSALADIVDYVLDYEVQGKLAYETARNCLIDTLGCGMEALEYRIRGRRRHEGDLGRVLALGRFRDIGDQAHAQCAMGAQ
ncbi:hypothetical protein AZ21_3685, partial [Bordetella bronchiseptica B20-10725633]